MPITTNDLEVTHQPAIAAEPVAISHAVFADYDGNAPSPTVCECATAALAEAVADALNNQVTETPEGEPVIVVGDREFPMCLPHVDGFRPAFRVKTGVCSLALVAKTVTEAFAQLG